MNLIENDFETALMQELPPNARDLAEHLFSTYSLQKLLKMIYETGISEGDLKYHHIPSKLGPSILNAALLAKITYFLPNAKMTKAECEYLITLACAAAGYPLKDYNIKEVLTAIQSQMPVLFKWLLTFQKLHLTLKK